MFRRTLKVGLFGLGLVLLWLYPTPARAQDPTPQAGAEDCEGCHDGLRDYWAAGGHGRAYSNPDFQAAWRAEGEDPACLQCHTSGFDPATGNYVSEGVACVTCHYPIPAGHPDSYIPTDISSRLCGTCHLDTFAEWEGSQHGREDLNCNQCHNPHTTMIRAADAQNLCLNCHSSEGHYYAFTAHAAAGLLCADCHVQVEPGTLGQGHGQRQHSFVVELATCQACHADEMHAAVANQPVEALRNQTLCYRPETLALQVQTDDDLASEPPSIHPLAFVLPAGFALVFGLMLAPVVENWSQRRSRDRRTEDER